MALPDWQAYMTWVNEKHDKYYSITIVLGMDGTVTETRRWGRNPDSGHGQEKRCETPPRAGRNRQFIGRLRTKPTGSTVEQKSQKCC